MKLINGNIPPQPFVDGNATPLSEGMLRRRKEGKSKFFPQFQSKENKYAQVVRLTSYSVIKFPFDEDLDRVQCFYLKPITTHQKTTFLSKNIKL